MNVTFWHGKEVLAEEVEMPCVPRAGDCVMAGMPVKPYRATKVTWHILVALQFVYVEVIPISEEQKEPEVERP